MLSQLEEQVNAARVTVLTYEALQGFPGFTIEDMESLKVARNELVSLEGKLQAAVLEECLAYARKRSQRW